MTRELVLGWIKTGLAAANPEVLVADALPDGVSDQKVLAIGKAAPAMVRGVAARAAVSGICVTNHPSNVPSSVELLIGEHPEPGRGSLDAGKRALEMSTNASLALISGGGSSLCEVPVPGLSLEFVARVTRWLLKSGLSIDTINLVRSHMSQVKCGGLGPIETLVISDVSGAGPAVVSSGPTAWVPRDADTALSVMKSLDIELTHDHEMAIRAWEGPDQFDPKLTVIDDGTTAAKATGSAAEADGFDAAVCDGWIKNSATNELDAFVSGAADGVTLACGEPTLTVTGDGQGGRNTHVALQAARLLAGTNWIFAAIATDGWDGNSGTAGAIVDGTTLQRGGDPSRALARFDSARYLAAIGDTVESWETGTNVADLWLLWKPQSSPEPILTV